MGDQSVPTGFPQPLFYEDRQWTSPFAGGSHEFINNGERVLDDRAFFHYLATVKPNEDGSGSYDRS